MTYMHTPQCGVDTIVVNMPSGRPVLTACLEDLKAAEVMAARHNWMEIDRRFHIFLSHRRV